MNEPSGEHGGERAPGAGGTSRRSFYARPPLNGVVLVTIGNTRDQTTVSGARYAHVARIHDLPSLIHDCVANR